MKIKRTLPIGKTDKITDFFYSVQYSVKRGKGIVKLNKRGKGLTIPLPRFTEYCIYVDLTSDEEGSRPSKIDEEKILKDFHYPF